MSPELTNWVVAGFTVAGAAWTGWQAGVGRAHGQEVAMLKARIETLHDHIDELEAEILTLRNELARTRKGLPLRVEGAPNGG